MRLENVTIHINAFILSYGFSSITRVLREIEKREGRREGGGEEARQVTTQNNISRDTTTRIFRLAKQMNANAEALETQLSKQVVDS